MARFFDAELIRAERRAEHLWLGVFRRTDGEAMKARPGQFLMIHLETDDGRVNRSYSIANRFELGETIDEVEFAVALVEGGRFSGLLEELEVGETLTMTGPHGRFILRDSDPERTVLVATGTGIVPFRSMIDQLTERLERGERVDLLYGCRREVDFLYDDEFRELARDYPAFNYIPCASRPDESDVWEQSGGYSGRVLSPLTRLELHPDQAIVYLCGNPAMIEDVESLLFPLGFDRRTVRTEAYESPRDPSRD